MLPMIFYTYFEGEIWVSSPSDASGYLGHPPASREAIGERLQGRADRGTERCIYVLGRTDAIEAGQWIYKSKI
ncbi:hypothetical protein ABZP36_014773 [Zizania latifolia]